MELKGPRIKIRQLILKDVFDMRKWGYHDNPLLSDYNFPSMTDREIEKWYKYKTIGWNNKYYGILNEDHRLIGYMGIKSIKRLRKESTLGIVFDPIYMNQGYGTETLDTFLEYYFNTMEMNRMFLEVSEFNKRAYHLYEKMGFKQVGYYCEIFFDQKIDRNSTYYLNEKSSFVIDNEKIYNYIYKMKLTKKDFLKGKKLRS